MGVEASMEGDGARAGAPAAGCGRACRATTLSLGGCAFTRFASGTTLVSRPCGFGSAEGSFGSGKGCLGLAASASEVACWLDSLIGFRPGEAPGLLARAVVTAA